jgi:hypothetical protein
MREPQASIVRGRQAARPSFTRAPRVRILAAFMTSFEADQAETVRVVLDRAPANSDGFVYVAETEHPPRRIVATSAAFRPDLDLPAHRQALKQLESQLLQLGWEREPDNGMSVMGPRFGRHVEAVSPP